MNREHKYRAFHKPTKTMYWFDLMWGNCHAMGGGWIGMLPIGEERKYQMHGDNRIAVDPTDCEIIQFTGLHDKNGVDIYEGDIIKVEIKHGFNSDLLNEFKEKNNLDSINGIGMHFDGVVRIDFFRGLMFENTKNGYSEPMFTRHVDIKKNHSGIEIIGNIYETPDLLK